MNKGTRQRCEMRTARRTDPRAVELLLVLKPSPAHFLLFFFFFLLSAEQPLLASGSGSADKMACCSCVPRMK